MLLLSLATSLGLHTENPLYPQSDLTIEQQHLPDEIVVSPQLSQQRHLLAHNHTQVLSTTVLYPATTPFITQAEAGLYVGLLLSISTSACLCHIVCKRYCDRPLDYHTETQVVLVLCPPHELNLQEP